jgi:putative oxidoreductase
MTLVIEIFVYPEAYVVHGTWAAILIMLIKFGPGKISLDQIVSKLK